MTAFLAWIPLGVVALTAAMFAAIGDARDQQHTALGPLNLCGCRTCRENRARA